MESVKMEIQKWKKKKERAELERNKDSLYFACKELAEIYFNSEQYDLALQEYKEMEQISEGCGNRLDVGRANRMIGEVYCEKGEFDKAIRHQMKHLVISRDEGNQVEEQRALATLGRTYFLKAESIADSYSGARKLALSEAKKYYIESLGVCNLMSERDVGQKQRMEMVARLFLNIGLVLDSQNQFQTAADYMQKAVNICKKLDLWEDLYRTYSALGAAYHRHSEKNLSIKTYDLALDVAERLSNKVTMMCEVLLLKADVLCDLPDLRGARQALLRAYKLSPPTPSLQVEVEKKLRIVASMCECEEKLTELAPDSGDSERKKLYEEIGDAAAELNNFKLALTYYHLMLECVEKSGNEKKALIDSYISLAQTYKDDQQYTKALEYFNKELELEVPDSPEACKTLLNIAEVYQALGQRKEMFETYNQAKLGALRSSDFKLKKSVLSSLHAALLEDNKISEAEEVKRELDGISHSFLDDSSDEEEDIPRLFGTHISLDDLTDEEVSEERGESEVRGSLGGRTRTRRHRAPNIEKRNEKGETPLHVAAIQGNISLATKLIEQGHRVDVKDHSGWTPLHEASNHGHVEVVRLLLDHGAPVNDRGGPHCDGVTPLLDAATNGNLDVVQLLLSRGASPLVRNNSGETVLDCLSGWRRRYYDDVKHDISGSTLKQYTAIYKQLGQTLEKAGQRLSRDHNQDESDIESLSREAPTSFAASQAGSRTGRTKLSPKSVVSLEKKTNEKSCNAASDYENTIKSLRFKYNKTDVAPGTGSCKAGRALLGEEETVVDDWLEDDLGEGRPNKKRRTGDWNHDLIGGREKRRNLRPISPNSDEFTEPSETCTMNIPSESDSDSIEHHSSPPLSPQRTHIEKNTSKKKQILLSTSTAKKRVEWKISRRMSESSLSDGEASGSSRLQIQTTSQVVQPSTYSCVKVRIEGKMVIVPVPSGGGDGLSISWLATEAAVRYKSLEGVEPVLQLEMDGGLLVGTDPLSIVLLSPNPLIDGKVLSWRLESLTMLYQEACQALNAEFDEDVKMAVEECQATSAVVLDELYLSWTSISPLLRALTHYQPLQRLSLSSNSIKDAHILEVAECIVKLPHLKELDLSNTNLSDKGLKIFADAVEKAKGLERLEVLKLGYNPLEDCLCSLSSLLTTCRFLRHLSLPDVGLSSRSFQSALQLSLDSIEVLDISYNKIGAEGVRDLLGMLESRGLRELRLGGSGEGVVREMGFYLEQQAPSNLRLLDLSYCPVFPEDIQQFVKGARMCSSLEEVSLSWADLESDLLSLPLQRLHLWASPHSSLPSTDVHRLQELVISSPDPRLQPNGPYALFVSSK